MSSMRCHTTRNVSRAPSCLGLSQPAVSHALTRLRLTLKDPLFVRAPGGVAPTARPSISRALSSRR